MRKKNSLLVIIYEALVCGLPLVLFFSYYPVITLGSSETMNFELSLPILWLLVFDALGAILLVRLKLVRKSFSKWRYLLFPAFITLSIWWSFNTTRGIMTCGVMWLIVIAVLLIVELKPVFSEGFSRKFLKWFFFAALLACVWCVLQCILDVMGVSREYSLLCAGCTSYSFGFPHPNGFAIEPQFMGNLLLAPTIVSGWLIMKQKNKNLKRKTSRGVVFTRAKSDSARYCSTDSSSVAVVKTTTGSSLSFKFLFFCFFIFTTTLFLTFSRGAIYAFIVAMVFMGVFAMVQKKKGVGLMWGTIILAFLFTLNLQGVLAQVSPTNDTYASGVAKALNHLSLGIIDVREQDKVDDEKVVEYDVQDKEYDSAFDGYVAESTEIRKMMTRNAIKVWSKDFKTMMFGVGIGGAGQAMYDEGLIDSPKEIVQNEYASLLLEVGLTGAILAVILVLMVIFVVVKSSAAMAILTLLLAYGISLIFFAGLPNALQIYLLPVALWLVFVKH